MVVSSKALGFEFNEFCNGVFLAFQEFLCLLCFGLAVKVFISKLPKIDDLLKNQSDQV